MDDNELILALHDLLERVEKERGINAAARKCCTCDGAGRGPGRECVVKAGGRLGDLWRCADGLGA